MKNRWDEKPIMKEFEICLCVWRKERIVKTVLEQDYFYSTFFTQFLSNWDQTTTLMIWNRFWAVIGRRVACWLRSSLLQRRTSAVLIQTAWGPEALWKVAFNRNTYWKIQTHIDRFCMYNVFFQTLLFLLLFDLLIARDLPFLRYVQSTLGHGLESSLVPIEVFTEASPSNLCKFLKILFDCRLWWFPRNYSK